MICVCITFAQIKLVKYGQNWVFSFLHLYHWLLCWLTKESNDDKKIILKLWISSALWSSNLLLAAPLLLLLLPLNSIKTKELPQWTQFRCSNSNLTVNYSINFLWWSHPIDHQWMNNEKKLNSVTPKYRRIVVELNVSHFVRMQMSLCFRLVRFNRFYFFFLNWLNYDYNWWRFMPKCCEMIYKMWTSFNRVSQIANKAKKQKSEPRIKISVERAFFQTFNRSETSFPNVPYKIQLKRYNIQYPRMQCEYFFSVLYLCADYCVRSFNMLTIWFIYIIFNDHSLLWGCIGIHRCTRVL